MIITLRHTRSSMTLLGFTLPPESGEKISLGVTILLSMSVFMLQLTETLPPTSDAVSIIGKYRFDIDTIDQLIKQLIYKQFQSIPTFIFAL